MKVFFTLLLGLAMGGGAGYYAGTYYEAQRGAAVLAKESDQWQQQLQQTQEKLTQAEGELETVKKELTLNEDRPGFVTARSLDAPEFEPANLEEITSNKNGDVVLTWKPVKGAKAYVVTVEDESQNIVSTTDVEGETKLLLNRVSSSAKLPEVQYFVRISSVNGLNEEGAKGPKKPIRFNSRSLASTQKSMGRAPQKGGGKSAKRKKSH